MLQGILDRYGESRSLMKDMAGRMTAMGQSLAGMMASDEVVKGALAGYTFEHMEIASYRILIATAQHLGDSQAATALQGILDQEIAMADALEKGIAGGPRRSSAAVKQASRHAVESAWAGRIPVWVRPVRTTGFGLRDAASRSPCFAPGSPGFSRCRPRSCRSSLQSHSFPRER